MKNSTTYLEFWYHALNAEKGIVIETTDRHKTMQKLYSARLRADDPSLKDISIIHSPLNDSHLWLIKKKPDNAEEE